MKSKFLILVIDDEITIRNLCKEILTIHNYGAIVAENINEALGIIHQQKEDLKLVILDMQLSETDFNYNIPVLRETFPNIKIIAMSGSISLKELPENLRPLVNGFLQKPFTVENLMNEISKIEVLLKSGAF